MPSRPPKEVLGIGSPNDATSVAQVLACAILCLIAALLTIKLFAP